mmetsp:Transcript_27485/g.60240  ORF Transcript_27485/g.60240 Transcript_27485/m.60240 type:complete len:1084 (-) Transcript_27485:56-3307(-)
MTRMMLIPLLLLLSPAVLAESSSSATTTGTAFVSRHPPPSASSSLRCAVSGAVGSTLSSAAGSAVGTPATSAAVLGRRHPLPRACGGGSGAFPLPSAASSAPSFASSPSFSARTATAAAAGRGEGGRGGRQGTTRLFSSTMDVSSSSGLPTSDDDGGDGSRRGDVSGDDNVNGDGSGKAAAEEARLEAEAEAFLERMMMGAADSGADAADTDGDGSSIHDINDMNQATMETTTGATNAMAMEEALASIQAIESAVALGGLHRANDGSHDDIGDGDEGVDGGDGNGPTAIMVEDRGQPKSMSQPRLTVVAEKETETEHIQQQRQQPKHPIEQESSASSSSSSSSSHPVDPVTVNDAKSIDEGGGGYNSVSFQRERLARQLLLQQQQQVQQQVQVQQQQVQGTTALGNVLEPHPPQELPPQQPKRAGYPTSVSNNNNYAFQRYRLARQLLQPRTAATAAATTGAGYPSVNNNYAFQRDRLARQLMQRRTTSAADVAVATDNTGTTESTPTAATAAVDDGEDTSSSTTDAESESTSAKTTTKTKRAKPSVGILAGAHVKVATDAAVISDLEDVEDADADGAAGASASKSKSSAAAEEEGRRKKREKDAIDLEARAAKFRQIEEMCNEAVRRASDAADRVCVVAEQEEVATDTATATATTTSRAEETNGEAVEAMEQDRTDPEAAMQDIEDAVAISAQPAATEHVIETTNVNALLEEEEEVNEGTTSTADMVPVPSDMIDEARWDVEEDVSVPSEPSRRRTTFVVASGDSDIGAPSSTNKKYTPARRKISHSEVTDAIIKTASPERSLLEYADESEFEIARCALYHLSRATYDAARASVFALTAAFATLRDPELGVAVRETIDSETKGSSGEAKSSSSALVKVGSSLTAIGRVGGTFLSVLAENESSGLAFGAVGQVTHQLTSFFAAAGALGLRAGVKSKVLVEDYQSQKAEEERRAEEEKAEAKRRLLAKMARIAEEKRLEEERVAAEKKRMAEIKRREEERMAEERRALAQLKRQIEQEKKRVEQERIAAEERAVAEIRKLAETRRHELELELERNGLKSKTIAIASRNQEEKGGVKAPFFFVDE